MDRVVLKNSSVTFTNMASSGTLMTYQWYKNGTSIPGATFNTYTIPSAQTNDSGGYYAEVTNPGGTVRSRTAILTVLESNDRPVTSNDVYNATEDTLLNISAAGVLTNDVDVYPGGLTALLIDRPAYGSLNFNANGSFTYRPNTNFYGQDSFAYYATDGQAVLHEQSTLGGDKIEIKSGEPGSQSFRHGTSGDAPYTVGKIVLRLSRKSDAPNNNLNFSIGSGINSGPIAGSSFAITMASITNTSSGSSFQDYEITFPSLIGPLVAGTTYYLNFENTPNGKEVFLERNGGNSYAGGTYYKDGGDEGKDIRFQIHDLVVSDYTTVTIDVSPVEDRPVTGADTISTIEDTTVTISVLANDYDPEEAPLTVTGIFTTNGTALISGADVVFTPAYDFNGIAVLSYTVSDGFLSETGTVTVNVLPVNDAPTAVDDTTNTTEDVSVTIRVLRNDSDPERSTLILIDVTTTNGTAMVSGTNVVFTPATNFNGTVHLDYVVSDGTLTATGRATVAVTAINDRPFAANDVTNTLEDISVAIQVLDNDSDLEGSPLNLIGSTTTNGTAVINGTSVVFTPATNFHGTVNLNYTISDGALSATGKVTVTIISVNDAPIARADTTNTVEDTTVTVRVLANDTDVEGTRLSLTDAVTTNGTAVVSGTNVIFTPATNFNGTVTVAYTVSDGTNFVSTNATVTVAAVNDRPIAVNDSTNTLEDVSVTIPVLCNDIEPDGATLTLTGTFTTNGIATISGTNLIFRAATNFNGAVLLRYTMSDGVFTVTGLVNVVVTPANDPPLALNDSTNTLEDTWVQVRVLVNDGDPEGAPLVFTSINTTNGSVATVATNPGVIYFLPNPNFNGTTVFDYTITDGTNTATAIVNVTVIAVNDAFPVAVDDNYTTLEDTTLSIPPPFWHSRQRLRC